MYRFRVSSVLEKKLSKLSKKDKPLHEQVMQKIQEIINADDIEHYKNLRYDLKDSQRVHIRHFVLVFQFDKANQMVNFDDFDHHDVIYER